MLSLDLSQAKSRRLIALLISGALVISLITGTVIYVAVRNSTRAAAEHNIVSTDSTNSGDMDGQTKAYGTIACDDNSDEKSKESSESKDLDTSEEGDSTAEPEEDK